MSADNGVYIVSYPHPHNPQDRWYRIAHGTGIEDIYHVPDGCFPQEGKRFWHLVNLWRHFGHVTPIHNQQQARDKADELARECCVLEYGIQTIELDRPFPTLREVYGFALDTLDHYLGEVPNDASAVRSEQVYQIRFALMDVLYTLGSTLP